MLNSREPASRRSSTRVSVRDRVPGSDPRTRLDQPKPYVPAKRFVRSSDKERRRKPHDVQVVALDPLDERAAQPLDRIGARALAPLLGADVTGDVPGRQGPERDARRFAMELLPRRSPQTQPGDDLVGRPGERLEHSLGVRRIGRLAEDLTVAEHDRVDPEHRSLVGQTGERARLAGGVLDRIVAMLFVVREDDLVRNPELRQNRMSLRATRRQDQRRRRRHAHAALRAFQIDSDGQRLAQSRSSSSQ